jgi:uracil-DNA glycosylase
MIEHWEQLKFWQSGEWQATEEKLNALQDSGVRLSPKRKDLFRALDLTPFKEVKAVIVGQDPYPDARHANGVAFSIPMDCFPYPPSLQNIFFEYSDVTQDLKYPYPKTGCLEPWCKQGVLLWNAYPSLPRIEELMYLTDEILVELNLRGSVVFVSLGNVAQEFVVRNKCNNVLHYSHPSPLGYKKGWSPFFGSRLFSTINDKLCGMNVEPVNWRLP